MPGKVYGAILRINPLLPSAGAANRSANGQYSIPTDNPYTTNPSLLKEKYAGGFRNPQRFTWDSANGRMFIADIGQNTRGGNRPRPARRELRLEPARGQLRLQQRRLHRRERPRRRRDHRLHLPHRRIPALRLSGNAVTTGPVYRRNAHSRASPGGCFSAISSTACPTRSTPTTCPTAGSSGITELRLRSNGDETSFLDLIHKVNASATRADLRFGTDAQSNIYFLDKQDGVIRRVVTTPVATPTSVVGISVDAASISRSAGQFATVTFTRTGDLSTPAVRAVHGRRPERWAAGITSALKGVRKLKAGKPTATLKIRARPRRGGRQGQAGDPIGQRLHG